MPDPEEAVATTVRPAATPAMYEHCKMIYNAMRAEAGLVEVEGFDEPIMVWEGFTTKLFKQNQFSVPYYSKILKHLSLMGSIHQLLRGGSTTMSRWAVLDAPTVERFQATKADSDSPLNMKRELPAVIQQNKDLNQRVAKLEQQVKDLIYIVNKQADKLERLGAQ